MGAVPGIPDHQLAVSVKDTFLAFIKAVELAKAAGLDVDFFHEDATTGRTIAFEVPADASINVTRTTIL